MSEAAVFNLLEFHNRLDQAGKLRSSEVKSPFMADFLAEKRKETAEHLMLSKKRPSLTSDSFPVEMAIEAWASSSTSGDECEQKAFVSKNLEAPETHQRDCVSAFIEMNSEGNMFSLAGNRSKHAQKLFSISSNQFDSE